MKNLIHKDVLWIDSIVNINEYVELSSKICPTSEMSALINGEIGQIESFRIIISPMLLWPTGSRRGRLQRYASMRQRARNRKWSIYYCTKDLTMT